MLSLAGIFPPITTPFEDDRISFNRLAQNLKKLNEFELSGYVVLGSNGENVMLSEAEKCQVIETAVKYVPKEKTIIIGAGEESTAGTIDFIKKAGRAGGDAILLIAPHYYKSQMKPEVLERYYLSVAEKSPLPVLIYNVPKFTGLETAPDTVAKLAGHPNIIGMKESSGNITYQQIILGMALQDFQLLTGTANTLLPSLLMGAAGGVLALANIAPEVCLRVYKAVTEKRPAEVRELQLRMIRLNRLTTGIYGIGGLKFAMDELGLFGGRPRSPLPEVPAEGKREIVKELKQLKLI